LAGAGDNGPLTPDVRRALEEAQPDETVRVIVQLKEKADLTAATVGAQSAEARAHVVQTLQVTAERSQASLLAYLSGARETGAVTSYTSFWITNAVAVRARPDGVRALAAHPAVDSVRLDRYRRWIEGAVEEPRPSTSASAVEWNVARLRADEVWASLHISGTGAVVAGMDTGVDGFHPALQDAYRGYHPHGPSIHTYSWYDATDVGAHYPVDGHGHGSHTMGTMVGQEGIGVAPGARWIAVRVLNSQGYGYDSWIHAGFQWLLAPGGEPDMAPDVVNSSWGNANGNLTTFQDDLRALRAAGIFPVFSNGNEGPGAGTVGSPASLPEAFAVGATDEQDEVARFSSRGPSPWGEIRPHVAAPGVNIRSSLPGGAYGEMNGTSMAAPHVAGLAALLHAVSPTISITRTAYVITSTAMPLGDAIPNNDTGWGRVDAFAAVGAVTAPAVITGTVTDAETGAPIAGAEIVATFFRGGGGGRTTTDADGSYRLALAPGTYNLAASAFGYERTEHLNISVGADERRREDFPLTPQDAGYLRVRVTDASNAQPITATLSVLGTPREAVADDHTFELPVGPYTVRARRLGYRVVTDTAVVKAGATTAVDLALPPAPSLLLVDSGEWYYDSQIQYYRQALDDLAYAYDEWAIHQLPEDVPAGADLAPYDAVIWSAPRDAPGYIRAHGAITDYLSSGGGLILSGQDIGYLDGGAVPGYWSPYYRHYLKASFVGDNAPSRVLDGLGSDMFAGQTITIAGPGGADNQDYPDVVAVADPDAAVPVLTYRDGGCGGMRIGTCLDYRAVYLPFGFEGINDRGDRREVMGRALDWLVASPPSVGLELQPASQLRIGPPGSVVTHALRVRHLGQAGASDRVQLALEGVSWETQLSETALTLEPCAADTVVISVTVPSTATWDVRDVVTLTARSSLSPSLSVSATLTSKAPAPILLVDDDRWYEQAETYRAAMDGAALVYDLWQTSPALGGGGQGSPALETLQQYPIVVWWTGYDWYAPVTDEEQAALTSYLDGGGRLFLSAQDFLYYHLDEPLSQDYLGVLSATQDVTPTLATGVPEDLIGDQLGPWPLVFPRGYQNWGDGLTPAPGTAVTFRDQGRRGLALARRAGEYATSFFAFPFEALPTTEQATVMGRAVGWLSWLGGATFEADRGSASVGDVLSHTLRVPNDGPDPVTASVSNTLPVSLSLVSGSVTGPGRYDATARRLSWRGTVAPGEAVTFTYRARVAAGEAPNAIVNPAAITLEDHRVPLRRTAAVRIDAPDLAPSALVCDPALARPGAATTCTLALWNTGPVEALTATAVVSLPMETTLVTDSLTLEGAGRTEALSDTVRWRGAIAAGTSVTLTYRLTLPQEPSQRPLYSVAFLADGAGGAWERPIWLWPDPWQAHLPLVYRNYTPPHFAYLPLVMRAATR
jgi:uncharacterized repeat protein (TIGR01451 family)